MFQLKFKNFMLMNQSQTPTLGFSFSKLCLSLSRTFFGFVEIHRKQNSSLCGNLCKDYLSIARQFHHMRIRNRFKMFVMVFVRLSSLHEVKLRVKVGSSGNAESRNRVILYPINLKLYNFVHGRIRWIESISLELNIFLLQYPSTIR